MKTLNFDGLLFDLDGTLIDSSEAIVRAWSAFAHKYGIDVDVLLPAIQGKPAGESVAAFRPDASSDEIAADTKWLEHLEASDTEGVIVLPGTMDLLNSLNEQNIPWAIVTSGTLPVASARIAAAQLPQPKYLVTPEQITRGKPDPEPYLLGASKLGLDAKHCIVFEDAPAGIESGSRAGATTIGVLTQFSEDELKRKNADVCVHTLQEIKVSSDGTTHTLSVLRS